MKTAPSGKPSISSQLRLCGCINITGLKAFNNSGSFVELFPEPEFYGTYWQDSDRAYLIDQSGKVWLFYGVIQQNRDLRNGLAVFCPQGIVQTHLIPEGFALKETDVRQRRNMTGSH